MEFEHKLINTSNFYLSFLYPAKNFTYINFVIIKSYK
jgi:hypothetical protein